MQLEDFNHAMLRFVFALHLLLYSVFVFVFGLLLSPLGFIAILVSRARLAWREWRVKFRREGSMARKVESIESESF